MKHIKHAIKYLWATLFKPTHKVVIQTYSVENKKLSGIKEAKHKQLADEINYTWKR